MTILAFESSADRRRRMALVECRPVLEELCAEFAIWAEQVQRQTAELFGATPAERTKFRIRYERAYRAWLLRDFGIDLARTMPLPP